MKTRIYKAICPGCGKTIQSDETVLGVPEGEYADYSLKQISFECKHCATRFIIDAKAFIEAEKSAITTPPKSSVPEIQARWEAGEDIE